MRFTVPQFIEREPKIIGPLTFRQFTYIGLAGAICFVLYFSLAKKNFLLFLLITAALMGGAVSLAFLKIGGRDLPTIFKNFLMFFISPKIYLWRKGLPPKIFKKEAKEIKKKKVEEAPSLKVAGESRLRKLSTQVETKTK